MSKYYLQGPAHTEQTVAAAAQQVGVQWVRLPAAQQRAIFGGVPFSRREIKHSPLRGAICVRKVVGFGGDWNDQWWTYAEVAQLLNCSETVVGKRD